MSFSITLNTNNYSGQTGVITFYPTNGGVVNVGTHILLYTFITDDPYGTIEIFFPDFNKTCTIGITEDLLLQEDTNFILMEDNGFIRV